MTRSLLLCLLLVGACRGPDEPSQAGVGGGAPASAPAAVASVAAIDGELWQGERQLAMGDAVARLAELEVRRGRATLRLVSGDTLRLFPQTRLSVTDGQRVQLLLGKLWAIIAPSAGKRFSVETDNAVAGVRGTEFVVARRAGTTRVAVVAGAVAVSPRGRPAAEIVVRAGEQTEVVAAAVPAPPVAFAAEEESRAWERAGVPADDADGSAAQPAPAPPPKVRIDRKAFDKHEAGGRRQKKQLDKQEDQQRRQLKQDEDAQRKGTQGSRREQEEDLAREMGNKGSLAPDKGSLKEKPTKPNKGERDSEVDDLLK